MYRLLLFFALLTASTIHAQSTSELILEFKEVDQLEMDPFGNYYLANKEEIRKYNSEGELLYRYSDPILGDLSKIDLLNALNPLLYYQDVNRIIILDNRLNQSLITNTLMEYELYDPKLVSYSDQDNCWIYDQATDKLWRFNFRKASMGSQSLLINQIVGNNTQPSILYSTIDRLYLYVPDHGVFIFDALGAYLEKLNIKTLENFEITKEYFYYTQSGKLFRYNWNKQEQEAVLGIDKELGKFKIQDGFIYFLNSSRLERIKVPK